MVTKQDFGRFVVERRRTVGLTQRALAERLHVTESAVSKWERGVSYPDVTMVAALAVALGVSSQELINASEDREAKLAQRDARVYRRWRSAILWTTLIAYGVALLTCLIVNLAVGHSVSWFWTVLSAVALAFCLTTLPLLKVPHPGWSSLAGAVLSLVVLLGVCWLSYQRGTWLFIVVAAVLLALVVVFGPIWLWLFRLPEPYCRHRTVLALGTDSIGLAIFLLIVMASSGQTSLWVTVALPVMLVGLVPVWVIALVVRYLPTHGLSKAALVTAFVGCCGFGITFAVEAIVGERAGEPFGRRMDLTRWQGDTINYNVLLVLLVGCVTVGLVLGLCSVLLRSRRARRLLQVGEGEPDNRGAAG